MSKLAFGARSLASFALAVPLFAAVAGPVAAEEESACTTAKPTFDLESVEVVVSVACEEEGEVSLQVVMRDSDHSILVESDTDAVVAAGGTLEQRVVADLEVSSVCVTLNGEQYCYPVDFDPEDAAEDATDPEDTAEGATGLEGTAEDASDPEGTGEDATGLEGAAEDASDLKGVAEGSGHRAGEA